MAIGAAAQQGQLEDAAVVLGQSLLKLGSLAPGQQAQVVLDTSQPAAATGRPMFYSLGYRLFSPSATAQSAPTASQAGPGQLQPPSGPEAQRRVRLMDAVLGGGISSSSYSVSQGAVSQGLTFVGFTRAPVVGESTPAPASGQHPLSHLTLVEQPLRLELAPGRFVLPSSLVLGGPGTGALKGMAPWLELRMPTTYTFRAPLGARERVRVDAVTVTTQQFGSAIPLQGPGQGQAAAAVQSVTTPAAAQPDLFRVYNWPAARWDSLPAGAAQSRLREADAYVSPDGLVRVQVDPGAPNRLVRIVPPDVAIEGEVRS
jgi:hypothetical protein